MPILSDTDRTAKVTSLYHHRSACEKGCSVNEQYSSTSLKALSSENRWTYSQESRPSCSALSLFSLLSINVVFENIYYKVLFGCHTLVKDQISFCNLHFFVQHVPRSPRVPDFHWLLKLTDETSVIVRSNVDSLPR